MSDVKYINPSSYPDISNFIPQYKPINGDDLISYLNNLPEFLNIKTDKNGFKRWQKFVAKYMSPNNFHKDLLILHEMGSGKTCTAILCIFYSFLYLLHKPDEKNNKIILVVKNDLLKKDIKHNINICKNFIKNSLNDKYEYIMNMFEYFCTSNLYIKKFSEIYPEIIKSTINKPYLVIIDEIHQLEGKEATGDEMPQILRQQQNINQNINQYNYIKKSLTSWRRNTDNKVKIIFMTGTPIKTNYRKLLEIIDLLSNTNLSDEQNERKIFDKNGLIESFRTKFEDAIYQKISRFVTVDRVMKRNDIGEKSEKGYLKINFVKPSKKQLELFKTLNNVKEIDDALKNFNYIWPLQANLGKKNKNKTVSTLLTKYNLNEISTYYDAILNKFNVGVSENKAIVYFSEHIIEPGLITLKLILKAKDWQYVKTSELSDLFALCSNNEPSPSKKNFCLLSSTLSTKRITDNDVNMIIKIYTHKNNRYGKYIRLLLCTEKISFGFNLINTRQLHIDLKTWYIPTIQQSVARAFRNKSYFPMEESIVDVYIWALDVESMKNRIKMIEDEYDRVLSLYKIIDKNAIDCKFNHKEHISILKDNSLQCNFIKCKDNFKCKYDDKQMSMTIDSAYDWFFDPFVGSANDSKQQLIKNHVQDMFKKENYIYLNVVISQIQTQNPNFRYNEVLMYIVSLIKYQHIFYSKDLIPKFLGYFNNILYLKFDFKDDIKTFLKSVQKLNIAFNNDQLSNIETTKILSSNVYLDNDKLYINNETVKILILEQILVINFTIVKNFNKIRDILRNNAFRGKFFFFPPNNKDIYCAHILYSSEYHEKSTLSNRGIRGYIIKNKQWIFLTPEIVKNLNKDFLHPLRNLNNFLSIHPRYVDDVITKFNSFKTFYEKAIILETCYMFYKEYFDIIKNHYKTKIKENFVYNNVVYKLIHILIENTVRVYDESYYWSNIDNIPLKDSILQVCLAETRIYDGFLNNIKAYKNNDLYISNVKYYIKKYNNEYLVYNLLDPFQKKADTMTYEFYKLIFNKYFINLIKLYYKFMLYEKLVNTQVEKKPFMNTFKVLFGYRTQSIQEFIVKIQNIINKSQEIPTRLVDFMIRIQLFIIENWYKDYRLDHSKRQKKP